jgi:hypothetical protein
MQQYKHFIQQNGRKTFIKEKESQTKILKVKSYDETYHRQNIEK